MCICKNKICIWSDPGVNLPICKHTPVCICVRMRHLLTPSKICKPKYNYTCVFLAHANWILVLLKNKNCVYTLEPPRHNVCFGAKIKKNKHIPANPSFSISKCGSRGYILHGHVFLMFCPQSACLIYSHFHGNLRHSIAANYII